jgi:hypothetical protein
MAKGDLEQAIALLVSAAGRTQVSEREYRTLLLPLEQAFVEVGDTRSALTVLTHAASNDESAWSRVRQLLSRVPPHDRAMVAEAQGRLTDAAGEMESAGRIAAAAIYREKAFDWARARTLWSRLARDSEGSDAYVVALVFFNLARCARRCNDGVQARESFASCVRRLEHAADHFEAIGRRERAFDCFHVLIQVGRENGAFENVLEGYANATRILREDRLRNFAFEFFDSAIDDSVEHSEFSAAATFARDAADYARSLRLTGEVQGYTTRQGELWRAAAKQQLQRGSPPEMIANALLSAILAFGEVEQLGRVGQIYTELACLGLEPRRREHYARAALRYAAASDPAQPTGAPVQRGARSSSPTAGHVWHADVLEWEQRGSASEACASIMVDSHGIDATRRAAMVARLAALQVEGAAPQAAVEAPQMHLAKRLARVAHYAVLSPLEAMYAQGGRGVKLTVLEALSRLPFKRSFATVRAALREGDPTLVDEAAKTLASLDFAHAFDPLRRIFDESSAPSVRAAALTALVRCDTNESTEFVLGILEHGASVDRAAAVAAVRHAPARKIVDLAREAMDRAPPELRATLSELLPGGDRPADGPVP